MSAFSNILLKTIDFFLSPENLVSAQARMRARMVVFIFLLWALFDAISLCYGLIANQSGSWGPGFFIFVNLGFATLIKKSFSPEKVYFAYSSLFVTLQLLFLAFADADPLSFFIFITFIFINCLITPDLKRRLVFVALIFAANIIAFTLLYTANGMHVWNFSIDRGPGVHLFIISTVSYLATFFMISKLKAIAQSDLDLEILWQERAKRLEDSATTTKAMGNLLAGPIKAVQRDLEQFKKDPDPSAMDDLQKQLDELLLISKAVSLMYRTERGEEPSGIPSNPFMNQLENLLSAKAQEET